MLSLTNVGAFPNPSTHPQRQQANDLPSKPPFLFDASTEPVINVTFAHDSHGSTSVDLGVSGDGTSSRSRGRGPGVGIHTPIDPTQRLRITPLVHSPWLTWKKIANNVKDLMLKKFKALNEDFFVLRIWNKICSDRLRDMLSEERTQARKEANTKNIMDCKGISRHWITNEVWDALIDTANEMNRDVSFVQVFNRTHKHLRGHGDFIDSKSKTINGKDFQNPSSLFIAIGSAFVVVCCQWQRKLRNP
ncbi:Uncharacterized protein TCM_043902 [Theobroma cacao]|uniref:Uncharacterized protein n=1 Tax=Theobroma cacao TaxID=3641 RepID=A0A061FQG5_THECC|nr:Uncharacterized protein TCM_043902 [Theobroma cacao]